MQVTIQKQIVRKPSAFHEAQCPFPSKDERYQKSKTCSINYIPVQRFQSKEQLNPCSVSKTQGHFVRGIFLNEFAIFTLASDELFAFGWQHFGCIGCLKQTEENDGVCCCCGISDSHLLRDSEYWNYRVNIFSQIFINLRTNSTLIFPFFEKNF